MIEEPLFLSVIRNVDAVSRSDNPREQEDNDDYKKARSEFIAKEMTKTHGNGALRCGACDLPMVNGYHIHHKDGDHRNNTPENFAIRCPMCHMCEHIGYVGTQRMGVIVYVPEIEQAQLNLLQVATYSIESGLGMRKPHSDEYNQLKAFTNNARQIIDAIDRTKSIVLRNFQSTDPTHFANIFANMSEDEYRNRRTGTFSGLRVLFHAEAFKKDIELWREMFFNLDSNKHEGLHPFQWKSSAMIFNRQTKDKV